MPGGGRALLWRMSRIVRGSLSSRCGKQAKRREGLYSSRLGGKRGQGPAGRARPALAPPHALGPPGDVWGVGGAGKWLSRQADPALGSGASP